jgi:hypothetical protein
MEFFPNFTYSCKFEILIDMDDLNEWIIGDSVLRSMFIQFDMDLKKISFMNMDEIDAENLKYSIYTRMLYFLGFLILLLLIYFLFKWANQNIDTEPLSSDETNNYRLMNNNTTPNNNMEMRNI